MGYVKLDQEQIENGLSNNRYTFLGTGYIVKQKVTTKIDESHPAPEGAKIITKKDIQMFVTEEIPSAFLKAATFQTNETKIENKTKNKRNIVLSNPGTWCQIFPWNIPDDDGVTPLDKATKK